MAKITQHSRISHHTLYGSTYAGLTFSVPSQEDFTVQGLSSSWTEFDLALSEVGVNEDDNAAYIRIGNNINQFMFVGMTGSGGGGTYSGSSGSSGVSGTSGSSGTSGARGATGPAGATGGNGFNGTSGTSGSSVYGSNAASTVDYIYNSSVVAYIDPGATNFATNTPIMTSVSRFSVSHIDYYSNDYTTWFEYLASALSTGNLYLSIVNKNDASSAAFYVVSSITNYASYMDVGVSSIYGSGSIRSSVYSLSFVVGGGGSTIAYTPKGQSDPYGTQGQIAYDNEWLYIKNAGGWFKTKIDPV